MNRSSLILVLVAMFTLNSVNGQSNLLNAHNPEEIGKLSAKQKAVDDLKPMSYGYVDDRDLMWSKVVWEYIDLNERLNLPYYYPIHENGLTETRKSLFATLMDGILKDEITEVYDDTYFTAKLTKAEIEAKLFRIDTADAGIEALNRGEDIEEYIDKVEIKPGDIVGFRVKGMWYIDKRQAEMKFRILGIAPVAPDVQTKGREDLANVAENISLFWVWYPGARQTLYDMKVFNSKNSASHLSYDHLLNAKRFNSIIYREENIYGNRDVAHYIRGNSLYQVLESEKIKENIRDKELDIWNY